MTFALRGCSRTLLAVVAIRVGCAHAQAPPEHNAAATVPYFKLSTPRRVLSEAQPWEGNEFPLAISPREGGSQAERDPLFCNYARLRHAEQPHCPRLFTGRHSSERREGTCGKRSQSAQPEPEPLPRSALRPFLFDLLSGQRS